MYRGASPVFDVPEFPTLRRVKPLPKRRRTSGSPTSTTTALDILGPDATAEELLAHAETLSARMALQSYYVPILGGVQDFLAGAAGLDPGGAAALAKAGAGSPGLDSLEFGVHLAAAAAAAAAAGVGLGLGGGRGGDDDDDDHGDGDYIDHLQQPGNTKKRKVPANVGNSPRGGLDGDSESGGGGRDESMERGIPTGRMEGNGGGDSATEAYRPTAGQLGLLGQKRGKLAAATLAGLQHKEMLKSRKRQLAAVLGALSHGDTLALDQALSANYPFVPGGRFDDVKNMELPRVRLSKRTTVRLARAMRIKRVPRHPDAIPLPASDFTFVCPSATADRLIATKEEVTMLRNRFEEELERQAAKAVKLAAASKMINSLTSSKVRSKRERAQQRARTITNGKPSGEQTAEFLDQALISGTKPRGKKKKRSALANASNPHHLRNYVPSRLPHSGGGTTNGAAQANPNAQNNNLGPLPLRFLSAEIPPRRRKKAQAPQPTAQLTNPGDEWICPFCEYSLFYGDEQEYRRAVRNRKKILRRRRRARERAAAAAGGNSAPKTSEKSGGDGYEGGGFDPSPDEFANLPKQTKWKGDPNKDKERSLAGEQASYG